MEEADDIRLVPRLEDASTAFVDAEHELGLGLATIVPTSKELVEELGYYDRSDGSVLSLRRDCVTYVPHVLARGPRAEEFREWAVRVLDCWTTEEALEEVSRVAQEGTDIDDVVDALVVFLISAPPLAHLDEDWVTPAVGFLGHPDADVRDTAVAGCFFGLWRSERVQRKVSELAQNDPSEAVRSRARVLSRGWTEAPQAR